MKSVRFGLALASLAALSACQSLPPIYLTHSQKAKNRAAQVAAAQTAPVAPVAPAPVVGPAPAPVPPPAPEIVAAPVAAPVVVSSPVMAVEPVAPAVAEPGLRATRSGDVVKVDWTLPVVEGGYRSIEIMRNTTTVPQGRTRVRAVRASVTQIEDAVPAGAGEHYWYWLKLTQQAGTVVNIGPVEATEAR